MTSIRPAALLLATALLLAACRPTEPRQSPVAEARVTYEQAAQGAADIVGTMPLVAVNEKPVPTSYAFHDGCTTTLDDGELSLTVDGRYRLLLVASTHCPRDPNPRTEEVVKEGLYRLDGFRLRFGDRMLLTRQEPAPETTIGDETLVNLLFPDGRFSARGSVRHTRITVTLDDLHSLSFARR